MDSVIWCDPHPAPGILVTPVELVMYYKTGHVCASVCGILIEANDHHEQAAVG